MPAPAPGPPAVSPRVDRNLTALAVTSNDVPVEPSCRVNMRGLPVLESAVMRPSTRTLEPFFRYSLPTSPTLPKTPMRPQMVRPCFLPSPPRHFSLGALGEPGDRAP